MSGAVFKNRKREGGRRNAAPDGGSFGEAKLSVQKKDGRANTNAGSYEKQTQLDRGKPSIIKYQ